MKFTVSVTSSSGTAPTGTVKFSVDGTALGSPVTVASGAASINLTGLSVKSHTISAAYSGDGNYATATASESITVTAAAAKNTVDLFQAEPLRQVNRSASSLWLQQRLERRPVAQSSSWKARRCWRKPR